MLRYDKRPRPFVLRVNEGHCLNITLYNALPNPQYVWPRNPFPVTNAVSIHVNGVEMTSSGGVANDGSYVGANASSLVAPGNTIKYQLYAPHEGVYFLYSMGSNFNAIGGGAQMGQANNGLFGSVIVEPSDASAYRSQVTREELLKFAVKKSGGNPQFGPDGQPLIDYDSRYPADHPNFPCVPVLRMQAKPQKPSGGTCVDDPNAPNVFYTDLTAIVTGPDQGKFKGDGPSFDENPAEPNRREPYREFVIHYHELITAVQAFPEQYNATVGAGTYGGVIGTAGDAFAINYGSAGLSSETLANRLGAGPEKDCIDCKFEEFFLESWAVGDPAEVGDYPADASLKPGFPKPTRILYPDDPSNVYHSYLNDHVKFRILHAGGNLTHVHHQHAHQWLHTPNSDESTYLDSQLISPGQAYTLEIDYHGSGNRNRTIGDSIFHCHFYPHFAAGMWSMWRVHDTFEAGTQLQPGTTKPAQFSRAYPDGELTNGTPVVAVVPVPTIAMAPLPGYAHLDPTGKHIEFTGLCTNNKVDGMPVVTSGGAPGTCTNGTSVFGTPLPNGTFIVSSKLLNPGYPFFIPGVGGERAPHPPLDFACELDGSGNCKTSSGKPVLLDGGLPRHLVTAGTVSNEHHNAWDISKDNGKLTANELPEDGTPAELAAIDFSALGTHPSVTPKGASANFLTNGLPRGPQHGAPFADPAVDLDGSKMGDTVLRYQAADIQTDVVFNKKGWHYPQQRLITLWGDVKKTLDSPTLVQPFFFRANSREDIIEYWLANLVPSYYELDDFQVRTPTDILGQHIHLVKFDVLASDGASNGFNYEDGTFAYDEVTARIKAINADGGLWNFDRTSQTILTPKSIPDLDPTGTRWPGAQATIQRWYPDPLVNKKGNDRTIRTVFTHDHFGPSTHQQAGLYAGLLVEPEHSRWTLQDGTPMRTRKDGGPTSWDARILTDGEKDSYREFALEFQDLALAYTKDSPHDPLCYPVADSPQPTVPCKPYPGGTYPSTITSTTPPWGWASYDNAINPSNSKTKFLTQPTIITGSVFTGTMNVNYRNEPIPFRVNDPGHFSLTDHDPANDKTDLSFAFASIPRLDADLNQQPSGCPIRAGSFSYPLPFPDAGKYDPYTPLLRAYQDDRVQVRVLVGAYLFNHNFGVHGLKWLFEPSEPNSGWRDNQAMGISEHFEFLTRMPRTAKVQSTQPCTGASGSSSVFCADYLYMPGSGQWDVTQGLWGVARSYNLGGSAAFADLAPLPNNKTGGGPARSSICPPGAPKRSYDVTSVTAKPLTYNARVPASTGAAIINGVPVTTTSDMGGAPNILRWQVTGAKNLDDPAVLRANSGDCVTVTLHNNVSTKDGGFFFRIWQTPDLVVQALGSPFTDSKNNQVTSNYFPSWNTGIHPQLLSADVTSSIGMNVGVNPTQTVAPGASGKYTWYAGASETWDSAAADKPVEFGSANLIPSDLLEHASWAMVGAFVTEPKGSVWPAGATTVARVKPGGGTSSFAEFVTVLTNNTYLDTIGAVGSYTYNTMNNTTEPMNYRYNKKGSATVDNAVNVAAAYSNFLPVPGTSPAQSWGDPGLVFHASPGEPVRFRLVHPDGIGGFPDDVIKLHGHVWQEEPYANGSTTLGANRASNWFGARDGFGPQNHFDILVKAGGTSSVHGDYLLASSPGAEQLMGNWALFRVCDPEKERCDHRVVTPPVTYPATASAPSGQSHVERPSGNVNDPNRFVLRPKPEPKPEDLKQQAPPTPPSPKP
jgi:hypothetical protein